MSNGHERITTVEALKEEAKELYGRSDFDKLDDTYTKFAFDQKQSALCFSGGGIRSASFAVGVIQGLAKLNVLQHFHYLSTVSGGGYAGSWLIRWIHEKQGDPNAVVSVLKESAERGKQPEEIGWLRRFSNYLTPRVGLASADTGAAAVIYVRNLLMLWLIFAPLFILLALSVQTVDTVSEIMCLSVAYGLVGVAAIALGFGTYKMVSELPSCRSNGLNNAGLEPKDVSHLIVWPGLGWAFGIPVAIARFVNGGWVVHGGTAEGILGFCITDHSGVFLIAATIATVSFVASMGGFFFARRCHLRLRGIVLWAVCAAVSAVLAGCGVLLAGALVAADWQVSVILCLGPLWLTVSNALLPALYVAVRRNGEGPGNPDREWLARLSAVKLSAVFGWALLAGAVLVLARALILHGDAVSQGLTAATAAITGPVAILGGKSAWSVVESLVSPSDQKRTFSFSQLVTIAAAITLVLLLVGGAAAANALSEGLINCLPGAIKWLGCSTLTPMPSLASQVVLALVLGLLLCLASRRIEINSLSLQGLYRNRLVRAYLGASRHWRRNPDAFSGFDPNDNIRMHKLLVPNISGSRRLFPVINTTLNLVGRVPLEWQQRKAESFTITPLRCGSAQLEFERDFYRHKSGLGGAYVRSDIYGGKEDENGDQGTGISLGTAMAISGAAASPNMGYHSSPTTAFLMTLFNVRLGSWLPNPATKKEDMLSQSGPQCTLRPLMAEMLGNADDQGPDVYLSDGGHFDNTGVYEMLRRRCQFILLSDAGCDPDRTFSDLGSLVHKARVDHRVEITFNDIHQIPGRNDKGPCGNRAFTIGKIMYPGGSEGTLIYLRPVFYEGIPVDILSYGLANTDFPQQSTNDQWFDEDQFESYRRLGELIALSLVPKGEDVSSIEAFFKAASH